MHALTDPEHKELYSTAIAQARSTSDAAFQGWFDKAKSVEEATVRGYWDFSFHILTPSVVRHLSSPHAKTALEIGHGGGRIINAASSFFGNAIGVDVHGENTTVEAFLQKNGKTNVKLIRGDGRTLPVPDSSIDFVYSFIVLQHLPTYTAFESYVKETWRCLKPGGVAQLYFGKLPGRNPERFLKCLLSGYYEITDAMVNCRSLAVRPWKMKQLCRRLGFRIVGGGPSYKGVPDGYPKRFGGQKYVTLVKPK